MPKRSNTSVPTTSVPSESSPARDQVPASNRRCSLLFCRQRVDAESHRLELDAGNVWSLRRSMLDDRFMLFAFFS